MDEYVRSVNLSHDKNLAVNIMQDHFLCLRDGVGHSKEYEAPILNITGGPGVGKSFLVKVLDDISRILQAGDQLRMALYGIAAVNIDGMSLMSMMDIPIDCSKDQQRVREWDERKLLMFKKKYDMSKISCIIIDEISTLKPYMLAYLNARLQTACNSTKPFGGLAVIMFGDFDQLPPVGGPSIPEVAMMVLEKKLTKRNTIYNNKKWNVTTIVRQGVELFKTAKLIKLTTQHRSEDAEHTALLERMSEGETITAHDLRNYETLHVSDEEYEFATILTPGNRERQEFNHIQAKRWARKHRTNVVRWPKRIREKTWKGKPRSPENVKRAMEESCFWEMYVPEALGYLTFNINTNKRLANGIPIKYHSVSFGDPDRLDNFERRLDGAAPGEVITLDRPPDVMNVELFPDLKEDSDNIREMKAELRRMWKHGSLPDCPGKIVIPIELASKKFVKYKVAQIRGAGGSSRYFPSKVELADWFPIEPAFSVTIHKAQVSNPSVFCSCCIHDSYVSVYSSVGLVRRIRGGR